MSSEDTSRDCSTDGACRRQRTLAETQTAGFGGANGKVMDLLVVEFYDDRPAISVRHDRVDHPDPSEDRDPETTTVEQLMVTPEDDFSQQKVELGTRHGNDRVIAETSEHAPRAYIYHQRKDDEWTEQAAWELHSATGITRTSGETATDGEDGKYATGTEREETA